MNAEVCCPWNCPCANISLAMSIWEPPLWSVAMVLHQSCLLHITPLTSSWHQFKLKLNFLHVFSESDDFDQDSFDLKVFGRYCSYESSTKKSSPGRFKKREVQISFDWWHTCDTGDRELLQSTGAHLPHMRQLWMATSACCNHPGLVRPTGVLLTTLNRHVYSSWSYIKLDSYEISWSHISCKPMMSPWAFVRMVCDVTYWMNQILYDIRARAVALNTAIEATSLWQIIWIHWVVLTDESPSTMRKYWQNLLDLFCGLFRQLMQQTLRWAKDLGQSSRRCAVLRGAVLLWAIWTRGS